MDYFRPDLSGEFTAKLLRDKEKSELRKAEQERMERKKESKREWNGEKESKRELN